MMKIINRQNMHFFNIFERNILILIALVCSIFIASPAKAACSYGGGINAPYTFYINYGSVIVQRDMPIGSIIAIPTISGSTTGTVTCSGGQYISFVNYLFTTHSSIDYVYNTNIPGVGIREMNVNLPLMNYIRFMTGGGVENSANILSTGPSSFALVKTGNIPAGTNMLSSGLLVAETITTFTDAYHLNIADGATVTSVACSLNSTKIDVPLKDVLAADLTSVGTTAKPKDFDLGLNCDAGARINVMLTGTKNTDTSTAGVLQLTGAGTAGVATGVGIQVLYNSTPLALNNNIVLRTSAGGQETFTFTAQYYQTKMNPTVGSANAIATLNITYQ
ncbi:fimbrial protein [Buttiauxella agrestis]|uniref:fimbrial protein n=1 Tax=Buttiauxella agrestis TaxID=82977 RepID=UPI0039747F50